MYSVIHQPIGILPASKTSLTTIQEVEAVVFRVESNHVTSEHPLKYLIRPGEYPHDVPGGEGDVEEEAHLDVDLLLHAGVSDRVGSQHQVVVVEPNYWNLTETR